MVRPRCTIASNAMRGLCILGVSAGLALACGPSDGPAGPAHPPYDLAALAEAALGDGLEGAGGKPGEFTLGGERKRGLVTDGHFTFPAIDVAPGSQLRFDYGLAPGSASQGAPRARVTLRCPSALASGPARCAVDDETLVFEVTLEQAAGEAWRDAWLALPVERPGAVEITVGVDAASGGRALWGDLVVLPPPHRTGDRPPNVVLVSLDTLRADHLSIYGYARATTPFLARLARDMTVYENAFTPSTWTLPSHASLFTGVFPSQHGAITAGGKLGGRPLPKEIPTLAQTLQENGYLTLGVVAGPMLKRAFAVDRGFALYSDTWAGGRRYGDEVTALAQRWLAAADERPFFLFVNYFDPHTPVDPRGFGDADHALFEAAGIDVTTFNWRFMRENGLEALPDEVRDAMLERYDAEIRAVDDFLLELFDFLEARGWLEDTLVCIVGDHGESYGEHGIWGHGGPFLDAQARIPFLYRNPTDPQRPARSAEPISTVEAPSMILADLGIEAPAGGLTPGSRPVYGERFSPSGSVRMWVDGETRYLVRIRQGEDGPRRTEQIFDLAEPGGPNLARQEPARLDAMRGRFEALVRSHGLADDSVAAAPAPDAPIAGDEDELHEQLKALGYVE